MSKPVKWLIVIFIAWWIIHDPTSASHGLGRLGALATQAANSAATVLSSI